MSAVIYNCLERVVLRLSTQRPILRPIMLNAFILQQLIERYLKLNSFVFQIHKQTPMILSPEHKQRLV